MLTTLATVVLTLPVAQAQDARAVFEKVLSRQSEREATVNNYTVIESHNGMESPLYHEKSEVDGRPLFRVVPLSEWQARNPKGSGASMSGMGAQMAGGLRVFAQGLGSEMEGFPGAGLVTGYLQAFSDSAAVFLQAGAAPLDDDGTATAAAERAGLASFATRARLIGHDRLTERTPDSTRATVEREAFLLKAEGLADIVPAQTSEAGTFTLESVSVWIDASEYVQLRLTMEGRLTKDGRDAPVTIELSNERYQSAGPLYLPTRKIMRISGLMDADPKQREEMEKARKAAEKAKADMARMKEQLARMPAGQRRMIENQMTKMLAQIEQMTDEGVIEALIEREIIGVNQGPPFDWTPRAITGR